MSKQKKTLGYRLTDMVANPDLLVKTPEDRKALKKLKKKFSRHCRTKSKE